MEFGDIKIFMINSYITFLSFTTETCIQGVNVKHLKTKLVSECHIMSLNVLHEKRNSISTSNHILLCLWYKHLTNKKKST